MFCSPIKRVNFNHWMKLIRLTGTSHLSWPLAEMECLFVCLFRVSGSVLNINCTNRSFNELFSHSQQNKNIQTWNQIIVLTSSSRIFINIEHAKVLLAKESYFIHFRQPSLRVILHLIEFSAEVHLIIQFVIGLGVT